MHGKLLCPGSILQFIGTQLVKHRPQLNHSARLGKELPDLGKIIAKTNIWEPGSTLPIYKSVLLMIKDLRAKILLIYELCKKKQPRTQHITQVRQDHDKAPRKKEL